MEKEPTFTHRRPIPSSPEALRECVLNQEPRLLNAAKKVAEWVTHPAFIERFCDPYQQPRALIVGGFVRDSILGLHPKDLDLEVYGVEPETLKVMLEYIFAAPIKNVGEAFGVLKVPLGDGLELDISIPRHESKASPKQSSLSPQSILTSRGKRIIERTPEELEAELEAEILISSDPQMSIIEAARRRDFTMNTLCADPITGEVIDNYDALNDLRNGVLRVTDPIRFQDDPLRVYRGAQFAARMNLVVEQETFELMREMVERGDMDYLSRERIVEEWKKLLLKSKHPSIGIELMRELGIIERDYPELHALIGTPQEHEWHPEGDVWIHTMMVVDEAAKIIHRIDQGFTYQEKLEIMVGSLCHDLGKPSTTKIEDGRIRSRGHEEAGIEPTRSFLRRYQFSNSIEKAAEIIAAEHLKCDMLFRDLLTDRISEKQYQNLVRRLITRIHPVSWRVLIAASEADSRGRDVPGCKTAPYRSGDLFRDTVLTYKLDTVGKAPLLQGRDLITLGVPPGKRMGEVIRYIEALRDAGDVQTKEEAILAVKRFLHTH